MSDQGAWLGNNQIMQGMLNQATQRPYGLHAMSTAKEMREFTASTVRQKIVALRQHLAEVPKVQQQLQELEEFLSELTSE